MTLDEYKKELKAHDWTYEMSDDSRVFNRGCVNETRLRSIASQHGFSFKLAFNREYVRVCKSINPDVAAEGPFKLDPLF